MGFVAYLRPAMFFSRLFRRKHTVHSTVHQAERLKKNREEGLLALRDAVHNLPFYLNLSYPEDTEFCHQAFCRIAYFATSDSQGPRMHGILTEGQMRRLEGKGTLSGDPLTQKDFDEALAGDMTAAMRIVRVMLWEDRLRFMTKSDWHTNISESA
jgi:hypothetical protein